MTTQIFKYAFTDQASMTDVEAAFLLAIFAVESLHGESETRLLAEHAMDSEKRTCVIDAGTDVGQDLNRLFVGFLTREFGPDSFRVERLDAHSAMGRTVSV